MSESSNWIDLGPTEKFISDKVTSIKIDKTTLAIIYKDEKFGVISGVCNHVGGPLGEGNLDGDYVVCPWHYWKFHFQTGEGEPGYEADKVPSYKWKMENGNLWVDLLIPKLKEAKVLMNHIRLQDRLSANLAMLDLLVFPLPL